MIFVGITRVGVKVYTVTNSTGAELFDSDGRVESQKFTHLL